MAPKDAEARERRLRALLLHASMIGSNGVPNADDSLPPSGPTLRQAFDALIKLESWVKEATRQ